MQIYERSVSLPNWTKYIFVSCFIYTLLLLLRIHIRNSLFHYDCLNLAVVLPHDVAYAHMSDWCIRLFNLFYNTIEILNPWYLCKGLRLAVIDFVWVESSTYSLSSFFYHSLPLQDSHNSSYSRTETYGCDLKTHSKPITFPPSSSYRFYYIKIKRMKENKMKYT